MIVYECFFESARFSLPIFIYLPCPPHWASRLPPDQLYSSVVPTPIFSTGITTNMSQMNSDIAPQIEAKSYHDETIHVEQADDEIKADMIQFKADAVEAENAEHSMTVLEAVKAYPMACFWAFVMSFTIVSCPTLPSEVRSADSCRLWNPTMYSSLETSWPFPPSETGSVYLTKRLAVMS